MTVLSMTDARYSFTEIADEVRLRGQRVCVKKNNKPAFAFVPMEDIELLEALEDKIDLKEALDALKEPGSISLKAFKKKLGL